MENNMEMNRDPAIEIPEEMLKIASGGRRTRESICKCAKCGQLCRSMEELREHVRSCHVNVNEIPRKQPTPAEPAAPDGSERSGNSGGATGSW